VRKLGGYIKSKKPQVSSVKGDLTPAGLVNEREKRKVAGSDKAGKTAATNRPAWGGKMMRKREILSKIERRATKP